jgi:sec-independent protein translocase protein TatA
MFGLSPIEIIVVGAVAVLLFGNKLPAVARSLGKSVTDFKKGMSGLEEEFRSASDGTSRPKVTKYPDADDRDEPTAPKFEPPSAEPKAEKPTEPEKPAEPGKPEEND